MRSSNRITFITSYILISIAGPSAIHAQATIEPKSYVDNEDGVAKIEEHTPINIPPENQSDTPNDPGTSAKEDTAKKQDIIDELENQKEQLKEQKRVNGNLKNQIDTLNESYHRDIEEIKNQIQENSELQASAAMEEYKQEDLVKNFRTYGFMDITFSKYFFDKESLFGASLPYNSSFFMSNINLYFQSDISQTISTLIELKLTFLPQGAETSYAMVFDLPNNEETVVDETEYERVNNAYIDHLTSEEIEINGVSIERAHLTYAPLHWFNITLGRYLTPYSIWNIDHASTVVIPIRVPFMQIRSGPILKNQIGFELFGRFFPTDILTFHYCITLSNGTKGEGTPAYDLNENKAVGLRLELILDKKNIFFSVSGYGLYAQNSDMNRTIYYRLKYANEIKKIGLIDDYGSTNRMESTILWEDNEYWVFANTKLQIFDITLQSEFCWSNVIYTKHKTAQENIAYYPSFASRGVYVLLSYILPIEKLVGEIKVIPYFMYEYSLESDVEWEASEYNILYWGLNIRPTAAITIKIEGVLLKPTSDYFRGDMKNIGIQTAVSF